MSLSRLNGGRKMATFSHHAIVTSAKEVMFATVGWLVGWFASQSVSTVTQKLPITFSGRHQVDRGGNMLKCNVMTLYSPS